ncbi:MAG: heavy metal translocating P-type ATPase [Candidatus Saccharimonadales bacterium]
MELVKRVYKFVWQWRLITLAILALVAALVTYFSGYHALANLILAVVSLVEVLPLVWGMWEDIRTGSYGIDILAATAIVASVLLKQYWAAIIVVIMLTGGESLEDYADHRALSELHALLEHAPTKAHLIRNKKQLEIKASELKVGDRFIVKPGELVPTDGIVIEGTSTFDESSLTGESVPVSKGVNEALLSGSINIDGPVTVKATALAKDSQYQQIVRLVESAAASRAPFVRLADRYSIPFTILAYAIAGSVWAISGHAIRFLEVIIVATPCPLLLAAPIALISGMSRASKYGIIVKTGAALEKLAETKTIAFDKTGTLTSGILNVNSIKTYNNFKEDVALSYAASLEQFSNHVIGRAITAEAARRRIKTVKLKRLEEVSGQGLKANFKSQTLVAGRLSLLINEGVEVPRSLVTAKQASTVVFIALDNQLVGYISLKDQIRKESKTTLTKLRRKGIKNLMLITGDNKSVASSVAKELGIRSIIAEALPADKLAAIEKVVDRPVAFVGDGVNDAPVLTASDIGIALGARGSTAASESADMVIMLDDISRVASAYSIARRTFSIARQSIIMGIALSVVLMVVFATGRFLPVYGAVLQEVVDVFVIFNALRAHSIKLSESI